MTARYRSLVAMERRRSQPVADVPTPCRRQSYLLMRSPAPRGGDTLLDKTIAIHPAEARKDPLLGANIRKRFGSKWYYGEVTAIDQCMKTGDRLYHVVYEDGDQEHLAARELRSCLVQATSEQTPDPVVNLPVTHRYLDAFPSGVELSTRLRDMFKPILRSFDGTTRCMTIAFSILALAVVFQAVVSCGFLSETVSSGTQTIDAFEESAVVSSAKVVEAVSTIDSVPVQDAAEGNAVGRQYGSVFNRIISATAATESLPSDPEPVRPPLFSGIHMEGNSVHNWIGVVGGSADVFGVAEAESVPALPLVNTEELTTLLLAAVATILVIRTVLCALGQFKQLLSVDAAIPMALAAPGSMPPTPWSPYATDWSAPLTPFGVPAPASPFCQPAPGTPNLAPVVAPSPVAWDPYMASRHAMLLSAASPASASTPLRPAVAMAESCAALPNCSPMSLQRGMYYLVRNGSSQMVVRLAAWGTCAHSGQHVACMTVHVPQTWNNGRVTFRKAEGTSTIRVPAAELDPAASFELTAAGEAPPHIASLFGSGKAHFGGYGSDARSARVASVMWTPR